MQTDRPLGEMSDDELRAATRRIFASADSDGFWIDECKPFWAEISLRATKRLHRAELSQRGRRERRSAPRETGAQDDA